MRGKHQEQKTFLSFLDPERMISKKHPIRRIKALVDTVLVNMAPVFEEMYSQRGRPSIPPERLLKALVLQALFTVRSIRQLCERCEMDLMFRWFLDMNSDQEMCDSSTFSHNQERLLQHAVATIFFHEVVELARKENWISDEHFSVDATLIDAWASMKSFRPKNEDKGVGPGNPWSDFKGEGRSNETHQSTTDPEAKLLRKGPGKEAKLCFAAHATMENRNGFCVAFSVTPSVGEPESQVAVAQVRELIDRGFDPKTVGADKGYHTKEFVKELEAEGVTAHPALKKGQDVLSVVKDAGYTVSQRIRKRIEELFGWSKVTGGFRKTRYRGVEKTDAAGTMVIASLNLLRMAKLILDQEKADEALAIPVQLGIPA
jgi:transposase